MGLAYAKIKLTNPLRPDLEPVECTALADTGAVRLCVPQHVALQLGLPTTEQREATLADGSRTLVPYAGPLNIAFANRQCFAGAMILGDQVLLGAIPMEDMDLVVRLMTQEVTVNPASPNIPTAIVK
jgi:clan AA aspartic protease